MLICLIARVIIFFLIDIVNGVHTWNSKCTNLQPVQICNLSLYCLTCEIWGFLPKVNAQFGSNGQFKRPNRTFIIYCTSSLSLLLSVEATTPKRKTKKFDKSVGKYKVVRVNLYFLAVLPRGTMYAISCLFFRTPSPSEMVY